jgi:hypothetical protein
LIIPLLVSKEFSAVTMVANGGVEKPFHDHNGELMGIFGLGFGRAIWKKVALMGDVRGESTFDFKRNRILSTSAGIIYGGEECRLVHPAGTQSVRRRWQPCLRRRRSETGHRRAALTR